MVNYQLNLMNQNNHVDGRRSEFSEVVLLRSMFKVIRRRAIFLTIHNLFLVKLLLLGCVILFI